MQSSNGSALTPGLWLRPSGGHAAEVQPVELFFDLVYALAVTQLTHHLLEALSWKSALETLSLLWGVWAGWICITWISNYFDVRARPVRLVVLVAAFVGLVLASSIPEAFGARAGLFATAVVVLTVGAPVLGLLAVGLAHPLRMVFIRVAVWDALVGILWLAGASAGGHWRLGLWLLASVVIGFVIYLGFPLPGLGRSRTTDYTITGTHMAERCLLFIILAIGESVLITGKGFGELPHSRETWAAFTVAFAGSVTMWWIYFDRTIELARARMSAATDPGRLGVLAYTFYHMYMVAGIIVAAAGDELSLAHPDETAGRSTVLVLLGGPALFLLGNLLYKATMFDRVSRAQGVAVIVLVVLMFVLRDRTNLEVAFGALVVLLAVAASDWSGDRRKVNVSA
ncbi:MAG: low temperature requirement protein A [Thermomicrobiales bacterium]|nr:MAG: low temperature requirement protein A [Thermomicrobiales bacterium]